MHEDMDTDGNRNGERGHDIMVEIRTYTAY